MGHEHAGAIIVAQQRRSNPYTDAAKLLFRVHCHVSIENILHVTHPVQHTYDLNGIAIGILDDQVRVHSPKSYRPVREILSKLADTWLCCEKTECAPNIPQHSARDPGARGLIQMTLDLV